ncbi:MAG: aconitase family protein [Euryarchaeota archaeon]|nr:aconitase family protein [Euryarchaeota archaeon]
MGEFAGLSLDQVCIGACTNGRIEDLRITARILKGEKAAKDTRLVVYPASRSVLLQVISEGVLAKLVEVGAAVCAPDCGFLHRANGCTRGCGSGLVYAEPELQGNDGKQQLRDISVIG